MKCVLQSLSPDTELAGMITATAAGPMLTTSSQSLNPAPQAPIDLGFGGATY